MACRQLDGSAWHLPLRFDRTAKLTHSRLTIVGNTAISQMQMLAADRWMFVLTRDPGPLNNSGKNHLSGFGFSYQPDLKPALEAAALFAR